MVRLERPAGWICAHYKSLLLIISIIIIIIKGLGVVVTDNSLLKWKKILGLKLRPVLTKPGQSRQKYWMVFECVLSAWVFIT